MTDISATLPGIATQRKPIRRWLVRSIAGLTTFTVVAFWAMPLWLPTSWMAQQLGQQLSQQLACDVRIGQISIGWADGVEIENLTMAERDGDRLIARVGRIRTGFSPWRTLTTGKVDVLEIDEPHVWVEFDEDGLHNLPRVEGQQGGKLPTLQYVIRDAVCHIRTPSVEQVFTIEKFTCRLNEATGVASIHAGTGVAHRNGSDGGSLEVDADVTVPQLNRALDLELSGEVHLKWSNLALSDLPVPVAAQIPIEQVAGTSQGRADFRAHPDLGIDFDVDVEMKSVAIRAQKADQPARVPDAQLQAVGHWNPNTDTLTVASAGYHSRALSLHKPEAFDGTMLLLDPQGEKHLDVHAAGTVHDFDLLFDEFPMVAKVLKENGVALDGQMSFRVAAEQGLAFDRLYVDVVGMTGGRWLLADKDEQSLVVLPAEDRKSLQASYVYDHTERRVTESRAVFFCGDLTFDASAQWGIADPIANAKPFEPWVSWQTNRVACVLKCRDLASLREVLPALVDRVNVGACRGPGQLEMRLEPGDHQSVLVTRWTMPAETELRISEWLDKQSGKSLQAEMNCVIPHDKPESRSRVDLRLGYGDGLIHTFPPLEIVLDTTADDDGSDGIGYFRTGGDCQIRDVDTLLSLVPAARDTLKNAGIRECDGEATITTQVEYDARKGTRRWNGSWVIEGEQLVIDASPYVRKSADMPVRVVLDCQLERTDKGLQFKHTGALKQDCGEVSWQAVATGDADDLVPTMLSKMILQADISDCGRWTDTMPWLQDVMVGYKPDGRLRVNLLHQRSNDQHNINLLIDATDASFDLPETIPLRHKPRGVVARCDIDLFGEQADDAITWRISHGALALSGLEVDQLAGYATIDKESDWREAMLNISGTLDLDSTLPYVDESYLASVGTLSLGGYVGWHATLEATPNRVAVAGTVVAEDLTVLQPLDDELIPQINKRADWPMSLSFDVALEADDQAEAVTCDLRRVTLNLADNHVSTKGTIHFDTSDTGTAQSSPKIDLQTTLEIVEPDALVALLPDSMIESLKGSMAFEFDAAGTLRDPALKRADVTFDDWRMQMRDEQFMLDGAMSLMPSGWDSSRVAWSWGQMAGTLSGHIDHTEQGFDGLVGVYLNHFDVEETKRCLAKLLPESTETDEQGTITPAFVDESTLKVLTLLNRCGIQVDVHADSGQLLLPPAIDTLANALSVQLLLNKGPASLAFSSIVDGGAIRGSVDTRLDVEEPVYHLKYAAERLQPGPVANSYLAASFPGLIATGPLTLRDESVQKVFPPIGEWEVGSGELIVEGGHVAGRAAPKWMTRIFPNLNLAQFDFSYMHSWFTKKVDGRIYHNMIFHGQYYNVYMIGYSERDTSFDYEVGLDFLADYDSKFWANTGQGRVPLFRKTGRLSPQGEILDEVVTYQPPHRIIDVLFVKNNPVVTAYYAVRRRALSGE